VAELLALTSRHLRGILRGRGARIGMLLFALGILATLLLPDPAAGGAGVALLGSLLVLVLFVTGLAVAAGSVLPEDRVAGREGWLSALAPAGWQRRLSVILAAWLLAVGFGAVGGLVIGIALPLARPGVALRAHAPVPLPAGAVLTAGGAPVRIEAVPGGSDLEIDVRPLFSRTSSFAPVDRAEVSWTAADGSHGVIQASARGPLRLAVPDGATDLRLALRTPRIRLRLTAGRSLGAPRSIPLTLAWTGFLLGLLAAAVVPVAVLVSRTTTGQTASAAAVCLLLLGTTRHLLVSLAADLDVQGGLAFASGLLHALGRIAPDVPLLHLIGEAAALHAPGAAASALVLPVLAYTAVVGCLACVPAPRVLREGVNA